MLPSIDVMILFGGHSTQRQLNRAVASAQQIGEVYVIQTGMRSPEHLPSVHVQNIKNAPESLDFSRLRNQAERFGSGSTILFLDADEWLEPTGVQELRSKLQANPTAVLRFKRRDYFFQKELRHGETAHTRFIRAYPRSKESLGNWTGAVHEVWSGKGSVLEMQSPIYHRAETSISAFLEKIDRYTSLVAPEKTWVALLKLLFYPLGKFFWNYLLLQGFRDGLPGFVHAYMMSLHSLIVRVKHLERTG